MHAQFVSSTHLECKMLGHVLSEMLVSWSQAEHDPREIMNTPLMIKTELSCCQNELT